MKIINVLAREVFDARGVPTIECEIVLSDETSFIAAAPAGTSVGRHEAFELRDGQDRFNGKGVQACIRIIEEQIAPLLIGKEPNFIFIDDMLKNLDGTENKSKLGANTMIAVSIAAAKAHAHAEGLQLYEFFADCIESEDVALPFPMFNIVNGGAHTEGSLQIQETLLVPVGAKNYREAFEIGLELFRYIEDTLLAEEYPIMIGAEGGFILDVDDNSQVLDFITSILEQTNLAGTVKIGLDMAASEFYDKDEQCYIWEDEPRTTDQMIAMYKEWSEKYPIFSIEDGLDQDDWEGWKKLVQELGNSVQIIADDLTATNPERIIKVIEEQAAHGVIIKLNQIGTVTETIQALKLCKEGDLNTIISHRSGETCDDFIADLAVGLTAGQIKAGGPCRGERIAKYNRLLRIEDYLLRSLLTNS